MIPFILALIGAVIIMEDDLSGERGGKAVERLGYIPSGQALRLITAGYHTLAADLLWVWSVVSFGEHLRGDGEFGWLSRALESITVLDPLFRDVYLYGGIMLAMEVEDPKGAVRLLERGVRSIPDDWQLHFFLGFYRLLYRIDPIQGIESLKRAASLPGHPAYLPLLVAKSYSQLGMIQLAVSYLEQVRDMIADPELKLKIETQIAKLLKRGRVMPG